MWVRLNLSTYKSEVIPRAELDKAEALFQAAKVGRAMEELFPHVGIETSLKRKNPTSV